ncbi:unnamed protein product [Auanema sp. JU1783]|nr:unnamed protein product [Auanema sp. JU1783]
MDLLVQAVGYFNSGNSTEVVAEQSTALQTKEEILKKRSGVIGSKCQIFYKDDPFVVSKASMQYVYDETGKRYLDNISNVQHVGHCHPTVVAAISKQLATSTCNVRFVSSRLNDCAEEILKTMPGFDTVLFCNSGSEANDLALQLARDFTKHSDAIVIDHAYHGHVTTTMQMSPYKFDHGSTLRQPEWVHVAPCPDVYRGEFRLSDDDLSNEHKLADAAEHYSSSVKNILTEVDNKGRKVAAYISEALQSCGGQVIPPKGYFQQVAKYVRDHGGLMVIDEVQTGYGRVGSSFWAYQLSDDGFTPDIVTMGKPMGNGFPVSAVVTTKKIADALGGEVGYFNTYGGNPVACAAVLSVISVIHKENLLQHSADMGVEFEKHLNALKSRHECVGDVRGVGMFWGIDLVKDRKTREPNSELALALILKLRKEFDILLNADGPHTNILKFKPPLCYNKDNLEETMKALETALTEMGF